MEDAGDEGISTLILFIFGLVWTREEKAGLMWIRFGLGGLWRLRELVAAGRFITST